MRREYFVPGFNESRKHYQRWLGEVGEEEDREWRKY